MNQNLPYAVEAAPPSLARYSYLLTHAGVAAWLVLVLFLLLTGWMVNEWRVREAGYAEQQFNVQVQEVRDAIELRMKAHEQILLGAAALFEASDDVNRYEWKRYVTRLSLEEYYPGIQAVGFSEFVRPAELSAHIARKRAEGFPDYQLRPEGERDAYTSIIYIEPFVGRNLAAFGFDMFAEPVRRQAMMAAVEDSAPRMSGKVVLVQENDGQMQPGLLLYIPVYYPDAVLTTAADRWAGLHGFVYSPYRLEDLMRGILGQRNLNVHFEIFSHSESGPELLYRSHEHSYGMDKGFTSQHHLDWHGQVWTVNFRDVPDDASTAWITPDHMVLALGTSTGILLFLLVTFLTNESQRAYALANKMTADIRNKIQELRLSEERFHLALDSSSMGTWNWYLAENIIRWDATIYPLFGLKDGEKLNTYESFLGLLHIDDRERVFNEIAKAMEGRTQYDTEYRVIWPDGSLHNIASRAKVLLDEHQQPLLMTGTCWDITEKKRIEKIKEEFVSTVSHELRTPLTSIAGAVGLLASGSLESAPGKIRQLTDIAHKNIQRLKHLIDDLLDMEKLSAGKMVFDMQAHPLIPLIKRALAEQQTYAAQYQVRYTLDVEWPVITVRVDDARFLQIMANLLSNAAKFSPSGSEVVVKVARHEQGVRITVQDEGIGIAEAAQSHIFEKFYQVDSSATRSKGGTGLGLSITRDMVENMHGKLHFVSAEGVGSSFFLDFPVVQDECDGQG